MEHQSREGIELHQIEEEEADDEDTIAHDRCDVGGGVGGTSEGVLFGGFFVYSQAVYINTAKFATEGKNRVKPNIGFSNIGATKHPQSDPEAAQEDHKVQNLSETPVPKFKSSA